MGLNSGGNPQQPTYFAFTGPLRQEVWDAVNNRWTPMLQPQGPAGPQGLMGPQGNQGFVGPAGDPGAQGADGPQGPIGADGIQGLQGQQGIQGIKGDTGDTGLQGTQGIQGIQGPAGPAPSGTGYVHVTGGVVDTPAGLAKGDVGLGNVDNTSDANKPVSSATQTALNLKAPLASPAFSGSVTGITKAMVGLTSVDDTSDANKPVSSATQTALNLKANLAGPTFSGTVTMPGPTISDATDITISAVTGTRFGQSGSKLGFFGVTPAVRPTTLTQTYATTSSIHAAVTQLAAPAGGTGTAAGGWSTAANRDLAITSINAARTDIANLKNFVNQIVDQLQALGLLQ